MYFVSAIHLFFDNGVAAHLKGRGYVKGKESTTITNKHLMEDTRLDDKNGVQMWEGDVIRYKSFDGSVQTTEVPSIHNHHWFDELIDCCKEIEVIGNIFENPELLPPHS